MIPAETVSEHWVRVSQMSLQDLQQLLQEFGDAQNDLGNYLIALEGRPFDEEEIELLLYISMVSWEILRQSEHPPEPVRPEDLQAAQDELVEFMLLLSKDTPADFYSASAQSIENHPEIGVFRAMVQILTQQSGLPDEQPRRMRRENTSLALSHLRIVLDALIARRGE